MRQEELRDLAEKWYNENNSRATQSEPFKTFAWLSKDVQDAWMEAYQIKMQEELEIRKVVGEVFGYDETWTITFPMKNLLDIIGVDVERMRDKSNKYDDYFMGQPGKTYQMIEVPVIKTEPQSLEFAVAYWYEKNKHGMLEMNRSPGNLGFEGAFYGVDQENYGLYRFLSDLSKDGWRIVGRFKNKGSGNHEYTIWLQR